MPTDLSTLASLCGGAWSLSAGSAPLLIAMFVAGATGSVTHCALMCGPLVLVQVAALPVSGCARARIVAGARFPYRLGRLISYGSLGTLAGAAGRGFSHQLAGGAESATIFLLLAAIVMASVAFRSGRPTRAGFLSAWIARKAKSFLGGGWWNGIRLGVVLGLLPCGLLYAALSVAASTANPMAGGTAMLAFCIGTMPSLVSIGTIGRSLGFHLPARFSSMPIVLNATLLALLAWRAWMAT